jgi:serine/threonine protein kinase
MTGKIYARKRIKRHREMRKEKEAFKRFETELAALKRLNHEHLVRVHGSYTDDKYVALLMSPVADYNLKVYLQRPIQKIEMPTFRRWYGCLANAIAYLKEEQIRHKDIKPENILVKGKTVFLTDFGTAWDWSDSKFADSVTKGSFEAFTPRYASPEVVSGHPRFFSLRVSLVAHIIILFRVFAIAIECLFLSAYLHQVRLFPHE